MAKKWSDVAGSEDFQALSDDDKDVVRESYFDRVVAPEVDETALEATRERFNSASGYRSKSLPAGTKPSQAGGGRGDINPTPAAELPSQEPAGPGGALKTIRESTAARDQRMSGQQDPRQQLPAGVTPSTAGAGRGSGNPYNATVRRADAPFADKREALDEAVNLIEEGADRQKLYDQFEQIGILRPEIEQHGLVRRSPAFEPQVGGGGPAGGTPNYDGVASEYKPGNLEVAARFLKRTKEGVGRSVNVMSKEAGILDEDSFAAAFARRSKLIEANSVSYQNQQAQEAISKAGKDGFGPALAAMYDNPVATFTILADSIAQSLPVSVIGGVVGSVAGPGGTAVGAGAGSAAMEYASALTDAMTSSGLNMNNPADVLKAMGNEKLMAAAREKGLKRGLTVGAFDAISAGMAGKFLNPALRTVQAGSMSANASRLVLSRAALKEAGLQMALAGGGEFSAQALTNDFNAADIAFEMLADLPGSAFEVAGNLVHDQRGKKGVAAFDVAAQKGFNADPPLVTDPPQTQRAKTVKIFEGVAAQYGVPAAAVKRAKEAANDMPTADVGPFLNEVLQSLQKRGAVAKPIEEHASALLTAGAVEPPAEDEDLTGLSEETPAAAIEAASKLELTEPGADGYQEFDKATGTLGVPRADMPQIKAEHRGAMVQFLKARGVTHQEETDVEATTLKPTQDKFSPDKVKQATEFTGGDRAILVSSDGYVLDGHHQWLAKVRQQEPVRIIRLDSPIKSLIPLVNEFPSSFSAENAAPAFSIKERDDGSGFDAMDAAGKRVGYLNDNLKRGQAEQIDESANVEMIKVDKASEGQGIGTALYKAFAEKHGGRVMPSGKTEPGAWRQWKKHFPEKVEAFVQQEAQRVRDGADANLVVRNITDPDVRARVAESIQDKPNDKPDVQRAPSVAEAAVPGKSDQPAGSGGNMGPLADAAIGVNVPTTPASSEREGVAVERGGDDAGAVGPRVLVRVGKMPKGAQDITLRENADGTMTPMAGKEELVDFDSGDPVTIPAGTSDADAIELVRASGAFGNKNKFWDSASGKQVKKPEVAPAPKSVDALAQSSVDETTKTQEPAPSVADLHAMADAKGVKWDNDPAFKALTKKVTGGKEHLDDLDGAQRSAMAAELAKPAAPAAPTSAPAKINKPPAAAPATLSDADAFASDFAAFEGKTVEQQVLVAETGQTMALRMDAAKAMRELDGRRKALEALRACIGGKR